MPPIPSEPENISLIHPKVLLLSAGVTTSLFLSYKFYKRYVRRIRNYLDLTPEILDRQTPLYGRVTRVGDGDNFRFYHTPGGILFGWGWLRHVPTKRQELKDETLMVRLCGVDAPERAHWGKPAQPYSEEALAWLKNYIFGRNVVVTPYSIDQYKRLVGRAQVWKWTGKKDISAEMLRNGLGVVYEGKIGAEFGDNESWYRKLEARAKWLRRGLWSLGSSMTTPGEFKKVHYRGDS
ncbi:DEHA2D04950p [Debaryomyces hansenii CBS767]|uniref:Probable endonuclease LCL3 n=1 Tax=Debaryomyces hansenii (strain ATCC 36239 / CBS 767 / BCRC 21394 / JCM 1990 / NBRC 0083 / IGC 2968) TaxID=284592 RepID=LCL3_DEBHA|nr:DEHA2D04950p [Debaryomyces hansenii CBS767]Q6BSY9.2 RecName: Full=Probable endonuclease LCL3 [Debaryomyces hansenii CBS767]CAG86820.2 DEHA2D04950p [Debaryomyces hansenii CBS767]|eukprot:XP_458681.2 DEHA2D04950p [Debaryomyces hansenii CBS767]